MQQACSNNAIGYDQHQRTTLFSAAQKFNFDLSKITVKCETDCSALVAVCINAAGISVSKDIYTGNMVSAIVATGKFSKLTDSKYLKSDVYLQVGDIVVKNGHTLIVLENGSKVSTAVTTATVPAYPGRILNATGKPFKRDEAVVTLQKRLRELDYYNDDLDGKFGPLTLEAVKAFQKRCIDKGINMGNTGPHKNGVDGSVGTLTWARLWE
ncbi:MAG TPA: hypothetical protein DEB31_08280 [Clostridiales bacterium]|nr:hypothetical protein [Clostridiales bacterium]